MGTFHKSHDISWNNNNGLLGSRERTASQAGIIRSAFASPSTRGNMYISDDESDYNSSGELATRRIMLLKRQKLLSLSNNEYPDTFTETEGYSLRNSCNWIARKLRTCCKSKDSLNSIISGIHSCDSKYSLSGGSGSESEWPCKEIISGLNHDAALNNILYNRKLLRRGNEDTASPSSIGAYHILNILSVFAFVVSRFLFAQYTAHLVLPFATQLSTIICAYSYLIFSLLGMISSLNMKKTTFIDWFRYYGISN
jgi:hypothetical protein